MSEKGRYLASLDLGSTKTRVLVAELLSPGEDAAARTSATQNSRAAVPAGAESPAAGGKPLQEASQLRFLGFGEADSQGWNRGTVASLDQVVGSIQTAVAQAEHTAGVQVESTVVGVGGPSIQGADGRGSLMLSSRARDVTREDVWRVMQTVRPMHLPDDREILQVVPLEFILDSEPGIHNPVGMQGLNLEVQAHIVTASVTANQNVVTAANRAGLLVEAVVLEAFAASEGLLTPQERELGVLVADLGGGSCELAAYHHGNMRMSGTIAIGGDHFTSDVAVGLHTPLPEAEKIKKVFGSVLSDWSREGTSIEVPSLGGRPSRFVAHRRLSEILEPRAQELLGFVVYQLRRCDLDQHLGAGVVLSGGGARLNGMCDLAEQVFGCPARLGLPPKIADWPASLDQLDYTTLVGLLLYGQKVRRLREVQNQSWGSRFRSMFVGEK